MIGPELAGGHGTNTFIIRTNVAGSDIQGAKWDDGMDFKRCLPKLKFNHSRPRLRPISDMETVYVWFATESFRPIESFLGGANNNEV